MALVPFSEKSNLDRSLGAEVAYCYRRSCCFWDFGVQGWGNCSFVFVFFSFKQENIESYGYFQLRGFLLTILDFIFIALSFTLKILVPDEVICSLCFSK